MSKCVYIILGQSVFRNYRYLWLIHVYSLSKELQCWEWKLVTGIYFLGGGNPNNESASNLLLSIVFGWLAVSLQYCNGLNAVMD